MSNNKIYIESLLALGGKKDKNQIKYVADNLLIRDKKSKVEYTVKKVIIGDDGKPYVVWYRYYGPEQNNKKVFLKINPEDFNKYEPVWEYYELFRWWFKKNN